MNIKKIKILFVILIILFSQISFTYAEDEIIPEITPPIIEEAPPAPILEENLIIRDGNIILFSGTIPLPTAGMVDLNDNTGTPRSINTQSVLSVLHNADTASADFTISNLEYYASFSSLYLKCIIGTTNGEKCDNWQYTVNNSYPGIGMDQNILSGEENIYIYFGQQYRILLDRNEITTTDTLSVTAEKYDYQNNIWKIRTGVTVGLTQPNPDNPWSPIEVKTNAVDANGQAIFLEIPVGLYNIGIKEDFYFPTESLTVIDPPPPPAVPSSISSGGGGGGPVPIFILDSKLKFYLDKAFDFLALQQKENGSFSEDLYTDWIAIAYGALNIKNTSRDLLLSYLNSQNQLSPLLTDNERRAMALLSLGENPYSWNGINYIESIINEFDGTQFGNINFINDDIFALIVLQNVGYKEEKIIKNTITYILSKQKENGSWNESVDMTGATMQAIAEFSLVNENIINALTKAKKYLKQNQKDDGGWGNISSTAWAIGGILALPEKIEDWRKNENTPFTYLATKQDIDGGIKNENLQNKIWETAYTITALSGKTWNQIMQKFEKVENKILEKKEEKIEKILSNLEEKNEKEIKIIKNINTKNSIKKIQQNTENKKEIENLKIEKAATVINAIENSTIQKTEKSQKNWFQRLLKKIFGF